MGIPARASPDRSVFFVSDHRYRWYGLEMIRELVLENFRGHESTKVQLEQFTLLVGDNGVGKTSTLESIRFLSGILRGEQPRDLPEDQASGLARSRRSGTVSVRVDGWLAGDRTWWLKLDAAELTESDLIEVSWQIAGSGEYSVKVLDLKSKGSLYETYPPLEIGIHLLDTELLEFEARLLAAPSTSDDEVPRIGTDGRGLATALQHLKVTDQKRFEQFQLAARAVVPNLEEVLFTRVKQTRKRIEQVRVENEIIELPRTEPFIAEGLSFRFLGTDALPASCASEGTLLALGLLAYLHMPNAPRLVLIDDIDHGFHPRAQGELVRAIRAVLAAQPDAQVIATSHSPYLVDAFEPKEVVVLSREEAGGGKVLARRLADHPDKKLVRSLTTGEFLTASGKGWFGL